MAPGSLSHIICLCDLFYLPFIFRSIKPKIPKYLAALYFIWRSICPFLQLSHIGLPISGVVTRKRLTTPLTRRVASICYLCAGDVYVVLLGSPTGSITLVSSLREIPTIVVLHHPFVFGKYWRSSSWHQSCSPSSVNLSRVIPPSSPWRLHQVGIHRGWFLEFPPGCYGHTNTLTLPQSLVEVGTDPRGTRESY